MKPIFLTLILFLSLSACNSDDNDNTQTTFEPITLDLSGLGIEIEDTNFTVNNYNFEVYRTMSADFSSNDMDGVGLAYANGTENPSTLELDLSSVSNNLSKITISIGNYCDNGCTIVQTLNDNGDVLQELNDNNTVPTGLSEVIVDNINDSISSLKIISFETTVFSIKLE